MVAIEAEKQSENITPKDAACINEKLPDISKDGICEKLTTDTISSNITVIENGLSDEHEEGKNDLIINGNSHVSEESGKRAERSASEDSESSPKRLRLSDVSDRSIESKDIAFHNDTSPLKIISDDLIVEVKESNLEKNSDLEISTDVSSVPSDTVTAESGISSVTLSAESGISSVTLSAESDDNTMHMETESDVIKSDSSENDHTQLKLKENSIINKELSVLENGTIETSKENLSALGKTIEENIDPTIDKGEENSSDLGISNETKNVAAPIDHKGEENSSDPGKSKKTKNIDATIAQKEVTTEESHKLISQRFTNESILGDHSTKEKLNSCSDFSSKSSQSPPHTEHESLTKECIDKKQETNDSSEKSISHGETLQDISSEQICSNNNESSSNQSFNDKVNEEITASLEKESEKSSPDDESNLIATSSKVINSKEIQLCSEEKSESPVSLQNSTIENKSTEPNISIEICNNSVKIKPNSRSQSPDVNKIKSCTQSSISDVKSRSHSPISDVKSRSHSPISDVKSHSHSPISDVKSRSHSPISDVKSRSHSEIKSHIQNTVINKSKSRSPSPNNKTKSRSPSPNNNETKSRSPSPNNKKTKSRSHSPNNKKTKSRSPSPNNKKSKSRSQSPVNSLSKRSSESPNLSESTDIVVINTPSDISTNIEKTSINNVTESINTASKITKSRSQSPIILDNNCETLYKDLLNQCNESDNSNSKGKTSEANSRGESPFSKLLPTPGETDITERLKKVKSTRESSHIIKNKSSRVINNESRSQTPTSLVDNSRSQSPVVLSRKNSLTDSSREKNATRGTDSRSQSPLFQPKPTTEGNKIGFVSSGLKEDSNNSEDIDDPDIVLEEKSEKPREKKGLKRTISESDSDNKLLSLKKFRAFDNRTKKSPEGDKDAKRELNGSISKLESENDNFKKEESKRIALEEFQKYKSKTKEKLHRIKRKDLENIIVQLFVDKIMYEHELGVQRDLCKRLEATLEASRKKAAQFHKEIDDLNKVTQRLQQEHNSRKGQLVTPVKVKRSVGIHVTPNIIAKGAATPESVSNNVKIVTATKVKPGPACSKPVATQAIINTEKTIDRVINNVCNKKSSPLKNHSPEKKVEKKRNIALKGTGAAVMPRDKSEVVRSTKIAPKPAIATKKTMPLLPKQSSNIQAPPVRSVVKPISNDVIVDLTDEDETSKALKKTATNMVAIPRNAINIGQGTQQFVALPQSSMNSLLLLPSSIATSGTTLVVTSMANMGVSTIRPVTTPASAPMALQAPQNIRYATPIGNNAQRVVLASSVAPPQNRHPAPLPVAPPQQTKGSNKGLPPQPIVNLSHKENSIVLLWKLSPSDEHEPIASYQLYAYQEGTAPPVPSLWKKVGSVQALELPMACTLTSFMPGHTYHFAVRAVDAKNRLGPFSEPKSIRLKGTNS